MATRLNLPRKKLAIVKKAIRIYNAGPQGDQSDTGWTMDNMVIESHDDTPDVSLMKSDDLQQVLDLLDKLGQREATVLRLRFGLSGQEPMTLKEIGEHLGLTRERVRQIERDALAMLNERMELC